MPTASRPRLATAIELATLPEDVRAEVDERLTAPRRFTDPAAGSGASIAMP